MFIAVSAHLRSAIESSSRIISWTFVVWGTELPSFAWLGMKVGMFSLGEPGLLYNHRQVHKLENHVFPSFLVLSDFIFQLICFSSKSVFLCLLQHRFIKNIPKPWFHLCHAFRLALCSMDWELYSLASAHNLHHQCEKKKNLDLSDHITYHQSASSQSLKPFPKVFWARCLGAEEQCCYVRLTIFMHLLYPFLVALLY